MNKLIFIPEIETILQLNETIVSIATKSWNNSETNINMGVIAFALIPVILY